MQQQVGQWAEGYRYGSRPFQALGLELAPEAWRSRLWREHGPVILNALREARHSPYLLFVPVREGAGLAPRPTGTVLLVIGAVIKGHRVDRWGGRTGSNGVPWRRQIDNMPPFYRKQT